MITFLMSGTCNCLTGQAVALDGAQHLASPGRFADFTDITPGQWDAARAANAASVTKDRALRENS